MRTLACLTFFVMASLTPVSAFADAAVPAGFPATALWVSQSSLVAGNTATVNAVAYNASGSAITGDLQFLADGTVFGSTHFSLDAGASALESAPWSATAGTHELSARIINARDGSGRAVALVDASPLVSVHVAPAPPQSAAEQALGAAAALASSAAAVGVPVVASALGDMANAAERMRKSGAAYFSSPARSSPAAHGRVLGASAEASPASGPASGVMHAADTFLLYVFSSPWLFYPFFLVLGFLLLYLVTAFFERR